MSMGSLLAAPLLFSGGMTKLDSLTLNVLCNPEVINIDQIPGASRERWSRKRMRSLS